MVHSDIPRAASCAAGQAAGRAWNWETAGGRHWKLGTGSWELVRVTQELRTRRRLVWDWSGGCSALGFVAPQISRERSGGS